MSINQKREKLMGRITDRTQVISAIEAAADGRDAYELLGSCQYNARRLYDELSIEGVTAKSVAIDYGCDPPELIVHADGARRPTPQDAEMQSYVLELPTSETTEREN